MLETEHGLQKTEKERKVAVGPGYKRGSAGHETSNCGEMRVRWWGLCALGKGAAEQERGEVGVVNRISPIQGGERKRKWGLCQDQGSLKLDMRQKIVEGCALNGEG